MTDAAHPLHALAARHGWTELARVPLSEEGGVDWSRRAFAKRWSYRRLGRLGLAQLLAELLPRDPACFVTTAPAAETDTEPTTEDDAPLLPPVPATERAQRALAACLREGVDDLTWLVSEDGRWLAELNPDGTFSFEFLSERNTTLLKRLRDVEAEGSGQN